MWRVLMRVCFVTPYSPREITGVGQFVDNICKYLERRGIESMVVTKLAKGKDCYCKNMIEIKYGSLKYLRGFLYNLRVVYTFFKLKDKIDVLHLQSSFFLLYALLAVLGKIFGCCVVTTVHGGLPSRKSGTRMAIFKAIERITFNCSNKVVFVDEAGKRLRNLPSALVIENGVDVNYFQFDEALRNKYRDSLNLQSKFVLCFVGRIEFQKGIKDIIEAVDKIQNGQIIILFVGPIEKEAKTYIDNQLALKDYMVCVSVQKSVKGYYCAADGFILPSYDEGLPLVLLEAMACGLPPIVTRVGGMSDVVKDHINGLTINPHDVEGLAQKIKWCIENEDKRKTMGRNASKTIKEHYDIEKTGEKYIRIYQDSSRRK